ncbi:hypothetical protein AB4097_21450 [Microvirga sp. 2MCAF35]|uniref:hypothetical protein n=1 Tax=Microvirga sp. 2MCAF35 TaxID=3232987 RepID=UPI003F9A2420
MPLGILSAYPLIAERDIQTLRGPDNLKLRVRDFGEDGPHPGHYTLQIAFRTGGGAGTGVPSEADVFFGADKSQALLVAIEETLAFAEDFSQSHNITRGPRDAYVNPFKGIFYDLLSIGSQPLIERNIKSDWGPWTQIRSYVEYHYRIPQMVCVLNTTLPPLLHKTVAMNITQYRTLCDSLREILLAMR